MFPTSTGFTEIDTFEELLAGVEQSYAEIDAVLETTGLQHTLHRDKLQASTGNDTFAEVYAPVSDLRFLEKGCIVITKITSDLALLQTVYITKSISMTTGSDVTDDDHPQVGAIADFVVSATKANIRTSNQMIENPLLERTMKSP
uniref:Uncharacterized protein n=1 Tax=Globisporangium ultimum (strain ATCC 200006 / CBS 805.95 / DAOM BR144) TaxID=431595 RepID=K3W8T7_GLOUD